MKNLSDYLIRFKKVLFDKTSEIRVIQKVFKDLYGVDILDSQITIQGKIIFLSTSPLLKNKIFLSKEKIVSLLQKEGLTSITEIR